MLAAYIGEFIFTIFYYLYLAIILQYSTQWSEVRFCQFIYPALCDFIEMLLFVFGLSKMAGDEGMVTKSLALPLSAMFCKWSLLKIRKSFNWK